MTEEQQKIKDLEEKVKQLEILLKGHTHSGMESSGRIEPKNLIVDTWTLTTVNVVSVVSDTGLFNNYITLTPQGIAPVAIKGRVYMNSDGHIYCYDGASWKQLDN